MKHNISPQSSQRTLRRKIKIISALSALCGEILFENGIGLNRENGNGRVQNF
jgi:hypothetical protein